MSTASSSGRAERQRAELPPPGSVTSMPSRVVNTGRTSPIDASATRRFSASHAVASDEGDREERPLAPQHRQEDLLVADLAEPEPVGVEADERRARQEEQQPSSAERRTKR